MKHTPTRLFALSAAAVIAALAIWAHGAHAQPAATAPAVTRTILLQQDTQIPGREALMVRVGLPSGSAEGVHTHPTAEVYAFVEEGTVTLERAGQPDATFKAGDIFTVTPPGLVHQALNKSNAPATLWVVFLNEKGKPLTQAVQ